MTTLTARDIPYEIKIRLDQNGVRGAHFQTLRQWVREDGTIDQERENDVVPLSLVPDDTKQLLVTVLGDATAAALTTTSQLTSQLEAAQVQISVREADLIAANATIEDLRNQLQNLSTPAPSTAERIADRRYKAQISGTQFAGMMIDTSADSQNLITGATLAAVIDKDYVCRWKLADGTRVELTAPQIIAIAQAVRDHVQHCYDREDELLTALADGTFTEDMLDQGWPS